MGENAVHVLVYSRRDLVEPLAIITDRVQPTALDEKGGDGGGSVRVLRAGADLQENPHLLDEGNLVLVRVGGIDAQMFEITSKEVVVIGSGEEAAEYVEVSGSGVLSWLSHAIVVPETPFGMKSDGRAFNFGAARGPWYKESEWKASVSNGVVFQPAAYGGSPSGWPSAVQASWVWSSPNDPDHIAPIGDVYFRREFEVSGGLFRLIGTCDDIAIVFIDGVRVLSVTEWGAWQQTYTADFELPTGKHVLSVRARNTGGPASLLLALCRISEGIATDALTNLDKVIWTGDDLNQWRVNAYPGYSPGFTVGAILLTLLDEAKARGVDSLLPVRCSFTGAADSYGRPWERTYDHLFDIGATYSDVVSQLEEGYADVWMTPDLILHAAPQQGVDRSVPHAGRDAVVFRRGLNVLTAGTKSAAEIANTVYVQTEAGLVLEKGPENSVYKYGRRETYLSAVSASEAGTLPFLIKQLFTRFAEPQRTPTLEIFPDDDTDLPWRDFQVGDWILAPSDDEPHVLDRRRVMSISLTEDSNTGRPVYVCEIDAIQQSYEERIARWLQSIENSSKAGGVLGTSTGLSDASSTFPAMASGRESRTVAIEPDRRTPTAPTEIVALADTELDAAGFQVGLLRLWWAHSGLATNGTQQNPGLYEVDLRLDVDGEPWVTTTGLYTPEALIEGLKVGGSYAVRVRAASGAWVYSEWTPEQKIIIAADTTPPPKPSAPSIVVNDRLFSVRWDGLDSTGAALPRDTDRGTLSYAAAGSTTWTVFGSQQSAGTFTVALPYGSYQFRLQLFDKAGNASAVSAVTSATAVDPVPPPPPPEAKPGTA